MYSNQKYNQNVPHPFSTGYFVCGHPTSEDSISFIETAVKNGLNAIEIGIPSENPYMDGNSIKQAHAEVLAEFKHADSYINYLTALRQKVSIPIWIMGYHKDLVKDDLYLKLAESKLINGFIIPDLNLSDGKIMKSVLNELNMSLIPVINNGMTDAEIQQHGANTSVVYCQLYKGKTGKQINDYSNLSDFLQRVRNLTSSSLMGGFGIKNYQLAKQVFESGYDGIVVGSKIVELVNEGNKEKFVRFIQELDSAKVARRN